MVERKRSLFDRIFKRNAVEPVVDNEFVENPSIKSDEDAGFEAYQASERKQAEELAEREQEEEHSKMIVAVNSLPEGWCWHHFIDGSGSLISSLGNSYFSYDRAPYASNEGIEFKKMSDDKWDVFWGTFEEFKTYAEDEIAKEFCFLGKFNIPLLMNTLADNAWYGREPTSIRLIAGDNVITLEGYTYEPSYECFSATSSISLNGEILYGQDSRNVEAYRYEVYMMGKYETLNEAVAHIKEKVNVQELVLASEKSEVDNVISNAEARVVQNNTDISTDKNKVAFGINL